MLRCKFLIFALVGAVLVSAAEPDADRILKTLQERHIPYGTILDPMYTGDAITGYTRCGDSATWTGHYLAALSFRYAVTKSPEALADVQTALDGMQDLLDVTGTNLLARCTIPADSPFAAGIASEEAHSGVYQGVLHDQPYLWIGNTSRDQYAGFFFGLGVTNDLVVDPAVHARVAALTTRALDFLRRHDWIVVMPDGRPSTTFIGRADQQLAFLQIGRRANADRFSGAYRNFSITAAPATIPPIALEVQDPHHSYFKFNLDAINFYALLKDGSFWTRLSYQKAYDILRNTTDDHGNAHFNMIDRAINGPNAKRDAETRCLLDEWLQRPARDEFVDLRGAYASCAAPDRGCQVIPVPQRVRTDFLWQRSPFLLYGGGTGTIEGAGIDYLLPYWMARYYGVLK